LWDRPVLRLCAAAARLLAALLTQRNRGAADCLDAVAAQSADRPTIPLVKTELRRRADATCAASVAQAVRRKASASDPVVNHPDIGIGRLGSRLSPAARHDRVS
jgi:hypothetical protein